DDLSPRPRCYTRAGTTFEGSPRRSREVGAKPTRSRHCKRGAAPFRVRSGPEPRLGRGPFAGPRHWVTTWEDAGRGADPRVRKPGRGALSFGARDTGRSIALLEAIDLSFSYRQPQYGRDGRRATDARRVLDNVSLSVHAGDLVGILGPNGSG